MKIHWQMMVLSCMFVMLTSSISFCADESPQPVGPRFEPNAQSLKQYQVPAWYNDADLAFEENQRLEDLLGQLAGTVIYSQKDLLMPPHVVGAGETLPAIAAPLGVNWQLLAKINGIPQPEGLIPGESLKVLRGPFDADVSLSRRRLTLR